MKTIAVVNQKGGCGKTTVSINLASAIAEQGQKVLLVDMDPQSHCAVGLAVPEQQIEQSIYDVLISKSRNEPIRITEILWQISDRLDLAPASLDLSAFEQQMTGVNGRELCLREVLKEINARYDYTVIDCPPAVGLLTFNALRAACDIIVPVETGYFALHGLSKQLETLSLLCERCNQQVNVTVLASMYDIRTKMAREILADLRSHFDDRMFKTIINFNTKLKEAASFGQPISEYDPASKGQLDFKHLAEEVIKSEKSQQRRDLVSSLANQLSSISSSANELLKSEKIQKQKNEIQEIKPVYEQKPPQPEPVQVVSEQAVLTQEAPMQTVPEQPAPIETPGEQAPRESIPMEPVPTESGPMEETPIEPRPMEESYSEPQQAEQSEPEFMEPEPTQPEPMQPEPIEPEPIEIEPQQPEKEELPQQEETPTIESTDSKLSDYYGVSQINEAVIFVSLYPSANFVQVAGDFNNWQPTEMPMEKVGQSGIWQTKTNLLPGKYQYRLVVDGLWQQDPYNENAILNPYGEYNSVLEVN
ncbi:MAG: AAA family ATPase [Planctomycetota bacterium]